MLDSHTAILDSDTLLSCLRFTQKHSHSHLTLTQTNSIWLIWWWQPSWILPSWIQPFWTKLWLNLIQSDSNSFILTQFDNVSHLEFCLWIQPFFTKKNFTHSFWLNFMMAAILNTAILDSAIFHKTLTQTNSFSLNLMISAILYSALLDSAILNKKKFTNSFWLKFMMAAILNSTILDSAILHKNTSLIHCDSSWWLQPSWILPLWIQPLPSWIQIPCYLLSDSLKNTLTPLWLWLKLVQSN